MNEPGLDDIQNRHIGRILPLQATQNRDTQFLMADGQRHSQPGVGIGVLPYTLTNKVQKFSLRDRDVTDSTWNLKQSDYVVQTYARSRR